MNNGRKQKDTPMEVEESSGNIFADIGLDNPEALLATAKLVLRLRVAIEERKLTEAGAARQLGIARADLAALLRGEFDRFSDAEIKRFTRMIRRPVAKSSKARATK